MPSRNELVIRGNAVGLTASNYPNDSKFEQKILYLEKNGTTYTETLGTGTFTIAGADVSAADTIRIGNRTYTFRASLTGAQATSTYTNASIAVAGTTVTIDGITYTYAASISSTNEDPYSVLVGANPTASLANLALAIDAGATAGTNYGLGTSAHPRVSSVSSDATTLVVKADAVGVIGNTYLTSENAAGSWTGSALTGGVDSIADEIKIGSSAAETLDFVKDAINNTAVTGAEGVGYSFGTKAHEQVTATTNSNTQQIVASRNAAFDNASIPTVVTGSGNIAVGAATLASGVRGVIVANATTSAGSAGVSGDKNHI